MRVGRSAIAGLAALIAFAGVPGAGAPGAGAAGAERSALAGRTYVVQMTQPQVASGLAAHLLPPLTAAFARAGLVYRGGPDAEWVATVDTSSDVGAWYGSGSARRWLYMREVLIDIGPQAAMEKRPYGSRRGVAARLRTPDEDRADEYACLVDLAVADIAAHGPPKGRRTVDGAACARP